MEGNAGGWGAVELPNIAPPLGSVLQQAIARKDKYDEQRYEADLDERKYERRLAQQQQLQQQKDAASNLSDIYGIPKQFNSNNYDLVKQRDNFLAQHQKEMEDYAKNHSPEENKAYIHSVIEPFSKWWDGAKNTYETGNNDLKAYLSENKHINPQDAKDHFNNLFQHDFFKDDGTGKVTWNPDAQPSNYIAKIDSPEIMKHMRISGDAVDHFIKSIPSDTYDQKVTLNNKGHVFSKDVTFKKTPFSLEPFIGTNGKVQTGLVSKEVNGQKEITPETEQYISTHKPIMDYLKSGFEKNKDALAQNGKGIHPANESQLFRQYAYNELKNIWPHDVKEKVNTVIPKPPSVKLNVNVNNPASLATQGFQVADTDYKGGTQIKDGKVYNPDGSPHSGEITIPQDRIGAGVWGALHAIDPKDNLKVAPKANVVRAYTKDGNIVGIETIRGRFNLPDMQAGIQKASGIPAKKRTYSAIQPNQAQQPSVKPTNSGTGFKVHKM